jgi:hypothetical protein
VNRIRRCRPNWKVCAGAAYGGNRDLSLTRARRLILAAIRTGKTSYDALTSQIGRLRNIADRNRHRARKSKSPSAFGHGGPEDTVTRIAPAAITMANKPAPAAPESPQNSTSHPPAQGKPGPRRRAAAVSAAPRNRRPRNVTRKQTAHRALMPKPSGIEAGRGLASKDRTGGLSAVSCSAVQSGKETCS